MLNLLWALAVVFVVPLPLATSVSTRRIVMMQTQIPKTEPNTTDAHIGKSLRSRVEIRKAEMARSSPPPGSTPSSQASVETEQSRDKILKLLSETELAQASTAEEAVGLVPGDEYIDLEHLEDGVQQARAGSASTSRLLPRSAVSDHTWRKILAALGRSAWK